MIDGLFELSSDGLEVVFAGGNDGVVMCAVSISPTDPPSGEGQLQDIDGTGRKKFDWEASHPDPRLEIEDAPRRNVYSMTSCGALGPDVVGSFAVSPVNALLPVARLARREQSPRPPAALDVVPPMSLAGLVDGRRYTVPLIIVEDI